MSAQDEHAYLSSLLANITTRLRVLEASGSSSGSASASKGGVTRPPPSTQPESPKSLRAYDAYLQATLTPFLEAANALGGQATELGAVVKEAWDVQRDFLVMATAVKAPANDTQIISKLAPVQAAIKTAQKMIQRNEFENHAKAVAEGMQALTWLVVRPAPCDYIENFIGAADFWGNKVRIQHKKTAPEHVMFVDAYKKLVVELMSYVKECHLTGVGWNPQGVDIEKYTPGSSSSSSSSSSSPSSSSASSSPSPSSFTASSSTTTAAAPVAAVQPAGGGRAGLLSQLGKGLSITSGLKKVSKDQQTWRPEFNKDAANAMPPSSSSSSSSSSASFVPPSLSKAVQKKPPSSSYDSSQLRWNVQHYTDPSLQPPPILVEEKKQSVYIYNCGECVIDIKGKGKSVTMDGCKNTQVVLDEMLSSLEVVNCQGVKVQVRQHVPTVAIDKTDGIIVVLSKEGLGTSFLTSKSSEMNIQYPKNEEGELVETPIPEQWQHSLEGEWPKLKVKNEVSSLYTH